MKDFLEYYLGFLNLATAEITSDGRFLEDVECIDITDIQEEEPGEEAYCVPI